MQVTARSEYAVRAVLDLARHYSDSWVLAREVAERQQIPPKFLPQILHKLRLAGFLEASRGAKGGFRLAKAPSTISVQDIVEVIQGPVLIYPCVTGETCDLRKECPICGLWAHTRNTMLSILKSTSFEQLANGSRTELPANDYKKLLDESADLDCPTCGTTVETKVKA